jgi:hypothetical protein
VLYPFCWLVFTLIRGAVISWYPYPFIDVTQLGYGKTILNCFWVSLLLFALLQELPPWTLGWSQPEPIPAAEHAAHGSGTDR